MKKSLLTVALGLCCSSVFSQVIFTVENPSAISGSYNFTYASNWGANLTDTANAVLDTVKLAQDSLACSPLTNDLTGKVALVYRGTCEFGAKALAAQNAGAVAVIIVNNVAGAPIEMGAGASGGSVTIPVVMLSQADGALLHDQLLTDDVVVIIGNKSDYYADDFGFYNTNVLRTYANGVPSQLAQSATDFTTGVAAWVFNYGSNDQTGITLNAVVSNGSEVYNETSTSFNLISGDSAYITLPEFSLSSYPAGHYTLTYTVSNGITDEYPNDNTVTADFYINDSVYSLARLNEDAQPVSDGGIRPNPNTNSFSSCIVFNNANGSRIGAVGMYFNASTTTTDSLTGQEISLTAYKWLDEFTDLNDGNLAFNNLEEMATGLFYYESNQQNIPQYQEFNTPFLLEDNQRYLFCATTYNTAVFFGYDTESKYELNENTYLQPQYPVESDGTYSAGGFQGGDVPALAIKIFSANELGLKDQHIETTSYPNPAKDLITVKVNTTGKAALRITDLSGREITTQEVVISNGQFTTNVSGFNAGSYIFNLSYENGTANSFKVVITK